MKKFDPEYRLLADMYDDDYYPKRVTDKLRRLIKKVITVLEKGERDEEKLQKKLDRMTLAINKLAEKLELQDSELDTIARECIAADVEYILNWFEIDIDIETALQERMW